MKKYLRTCRNCGKEGYDLPYRFYCSDQCKNTDQTKNINRELIAELYEQGRCIIYCASRAGASELQVRQVLALNSIPIRGKHGWRGKEETDAN